MSEQQIQQLDEVIAQRRGRYGPLIESGEVAMKLEDYLRSLPGWERLAYDQREALSMVMHKISRIMCGDPNYDDSWVDIGGYSQNVVNRLRAEQPTDTPWDSRGFIACTDNINNAVSGAIANGLKDSGEAQ